MAFASAGFSPDGRAVGPRIHSYTTTDAKATVDSSGYFNSLSDILKVGDLIYVVDSATPTYTLMVVLSNAAGVVDMNDGTALAVTDTD
jgi:hypothetical protein